MTLWGKRIYKNIMLIVLLLIISGCTRKKLDNLLGADKTATKPNIIETVIIEKNDNYVGHVYEIKFKDNTRCAVLSTNIGGGISCDWK